jgi:hypothetical protein
LFFRLEVKKTVVGTKGVQKFWFPFAVAPYLNIDCDIADATISIVGVTAQGCRLKATASLDL